MYKVLVVDDERLIRRGIISKLEKSNFKFHEILEAGSAKEALQFIDVDILITDISMVGPTGLELTRKMQESNPNVKTIIISGYSEFSYAAEAISLSVIDYLVKPINKAELYSSVSRAIEMINKEKLDKDGKEKGLIEEISANLSAFFQNPSVSNIDEISQYISLSRKGSFLHIRLFVENPNENLLFLILDQINLSSFSLGFDIAYYKDKIQQIGLIIAFSDKLSNKSETPRSVKMLIEGISNVLNEKDMLNYTFGISDFSQDPIQGYEQSISAMHHRIVFPEKKCILYDITHKVSKDYLITQEKRTEFLLIINSQSICALEQYFENITKEIEQSLPVSYYSLLLLFNNIKETIFTSLNYTPSYNENIQELYFFNSIREMIEYLRGLCLLAIESSDIETNISRTHQLVIKLQKLIQNHCDKQFTLEFYCDQNNINMSFFSSQFHQIAGVTFQEYLNTARMDNAKKLLKETNHKIGVISTLCGFSDQRYFSKTFKKHCGCTPREYKASQSL